MRVEVWSGTAAGEAVSVRRYVGLEARELALAEERALRRALRRAPPEERRPRLATALATALGNSRETLSGGRVATLLGAFDTLDGERWVVTREDGCGGPSVADYVQLAARKGARAPVGFAATGLADRLDGGRTARRRARYVAQLMRCAAEALAELHGAQVAHASLGPSSLMVGPAPLDERSATPWGVPPRIRLQDLAFSVDVSDAAMMGGATPGEVWGGASGADLYSSPTMVAAGVTPPRESLAAEAARDLFGRAAQAGAETAEQRRNYAFSEDVRALGLSFALLALGGFSAPGSMDIPQLDRMMVAVVGDGSGDSAEALREYVLADGRFSRAAQALDGRPRDASVEDSGWGLLAAMCRSDWRARPAAASILRHPFISGEGESPLEWLLLPRFDYPELPE